MVSYAELFAGAGGMSRGLDAAGFHCVAHAEIEPHARAVLRYRWPDVRLDGDVTQITGTDYAGITLLSGGSPCQDLSVAGKRAGLTGSRSSLFHEQCRIWRESGAPYLLWENVHGAFSSNGGRDFATVLSTIVGATIPVPTDGWASGGVAAGREAVAAWRVLDLQHFGPPQRRVRVFVLAARAGGVDPAEVLALSEGVCGHPSPREQSREGVAGSPAGGVAFGINNDSQAEVVSEAVAGLRAGQRQQPAVLAFAVRGREGGGMAEVSTEVPSLRTPGGGSSHAHVLAFHHTQDPISGDVSPSLGTTTGWMGLMTYGNSGMESWRETDTAITLAARDGKGGMTLAIEARPRRLTPRECERLMSWPDDWTRYGRREDGTVYELSDTARYRLCGNGVGSVCAEWIAKRLAQAVAA